MSSLNLKGLASAAKGAISGSGAGAIGSAVGGAVGNMIGGGYTSGVGSALSTIGSIGSMIPGPWGAAIGAGASILGGVASSLVGTKVDQEKLNAANEGTAALNNFTSTATSFDDIVGPQAQAAVQNAYSGGALKKGWAKRRNNELRIERANAQAFADNSVTNNVENIASTQDRNLLANSAAYGGPVFGAIDYSNLMDYMTLRQKQLKSNPRAFGGSLLTNGAAWDTGMTHINNGGSHESNPYEGVPMGVDPNGVPNLVEEGEVVWNDYVFSKRLMVPQTFRKKYKLASGGSLSFADAAKKFSEESNERPNDPISKAGRDSLLSALMDQQEQVREKQAQRQAKREFNSMSPEEQLGIMQAAQQYAQENASQQGAMPSGPEGVKIDNGEMTGISQNIPADGTPMDNAPVMAAYGGRLGNVFSGEGGSSNFLFRTFTLPKIERSAKYAFSNTFEPSLYGTGISLNIPKFNISKSDGGEEQKKKDKKDVNINWMRYAPVAGSGVMAFTDALGITNKPDYSNAERVESASNVTPQYIDAPLIGDYLSYNPLDRNYYLNSLRSSAAASRRALSNNAGGNRATAMAGILASDYNTTNSIGKFIREGEEYNQAQRIKVGEFNRGTNQYNASMLADIAKANQKANENAYKIRISGITSGAQLRAAEQAAANSARSANINNFLQGIGDIGKEQTQWDWVKLLKDHGYFGTLGDK